MARDVASSDVYVRAADGKEALGLLGQDYDLILLDLNLPGAHGIEVLREARESERHRRTPVVVFSSSVSTVDIDRAYEGGANAYVVKPSDATSQRMFIMGLRLFWAQVRK